MVQLLIRLTVGAVSGVLVLHPLTMVIYWLEYHPTLIDEFETLSGFLGSRMASSFSAPMFHMTFLFAVIGSLFGLAIRIVENAFVKRRELITQLEREMVADLGTLIAAGEGVRMEFKTSLRWDERQRKVNKALSDKVAKTITGFANHLGGTLFIGVSDDGVVMGLEDDYRTLKKKNRDGLQQFLMTLIKERLGGDLCTSTNIVFSKIDGKDICRLIVEPSQRPVYFREGDQARYFLRTGNVTRELDVEEALAHIRQRKQGVFQWPKDGLLGFVRNAEEGVRSCLK